MSKQVPEGWNTHSIGNLGKFFSGLTGKTSKDFGSGKPFLTYMQVFKQSLSVAELNFVQIDKSETQAKVRYGDILFTTSSETADEVGMTAVFLDSNWSPYLNSFCFGLRLHSFNSLYPKFARYFLRGDRFREDIRPLAQGSTRYNLAKENLRRLTVTIPPLSEQKKIASILASVDDVIRNTQRQIDKLQDLKKATMNELLTKGIGHTEFKDSKLGRIPKSWKTGRFGQFITLQRGHDLPVQDRRKGDIPIYGSNGIVGYHNKTQIEAGGVVTGRSGSIGDVYFEKSNYWALNTTLYVKDFHENDKEFVSYFLKYFQLERFSTGTGVPTLNRNDVHNQVIAFPDFQEQLAICEVMASIISPLGNLEKKLNQTQSLKKSLMQDLLTGKVRVKVN